MSAPRFYVDADLRVGARVALPDRVAHHAQHVLRLRDGAAIVLFNGRGGEYAAVLLAGRRAAARVDAHAPVERESPLTPTLVQALLTADKLDWIAEKATELGVTRLVLAPCARSVVRLEGARLQRRLDHLREVVVAACAQCGRNRIPEVVAAADWAGALDLAPVGARLLLHPDAVGTLADGVDFARDAAVSVAVGPEGGLTEGETRAARDAGWAPVRLGPRVLRTETAGLAALAGLDALAQQGRRAVTTRADPPV